MEGRIKGRKRERKLKKKEAVGNRKEEAEND